MSVIDLACRVTSDEIREAGMTAAEIPEIIGSRILDIVAAKVEAAVRAKLVEFRGLAVPHARGGDSHAEHAVNVVDSLLKRLGLDPVEPHGLYDDPEPTVPVPEPERKPEPRRPSLDPPPPLGWSTRVPNLAGLYWWRSDLTEGRPVLVRLRPTPEGRAEWRPVANDPGVVLRGKPLDDECGEWAELVRPDATHEAVEVCARLAAYEGYTEGDLSRIRRAAEGAMELVKLGRRP